MDEGRSPSSAADDAEPVAERSAESVELGTEEATELEEAAQPEREEVPPQTFVPRSGPPADWLERVARDAPWLLASRPAPAMRNDHPREPVSDQIPSAGTELSAGASGDAPAPAAEAPREPSAAPATARNASEQPAEPAPEVEPPGESGLTLDDSRATSPPTAPTAVEGGPVPMEPGRPLAADSPGGIAPSREIDRRPGADQMPETASPSRRVVPGQSSAGATGVDGPDRTTAPASSSGPLWRRAAPEIDSTLGLDAVERRGSRDQFGPPQGENWPDQRRVEPNGGHVMPPVRAVESGGPQQGEQGRMEWPALSRAVSPSDSLAHDQLTDVEERWTFDAAWPELPDERPSDGALDIESALRARERWQRRLREQELA